MHTETETEESLHGQDASNDSPFFEIRSLTKILGVLSSFGPQHTHLNLREVAREAGLSRATAYRVLRTLEMHGFVEFDVVSKSYLLGSAFVPLAHALRTKEYIAAALHRDLESLARATGEAAGLFMEAGVAQATQIDLVQGSALLNYGSPGGRLADLNYSVCKILAADHDLEEIRELLKADVVSTQYSITDRAQMLATLDAVRTDGVAFDLQESSLKVCSVAAPVRGAAGSLVAVIALIAMAEHFVPGVRPMWTEQVKATALRMSQRLGYLPGD